MKTRFISKIFCLWLLLGVTAVVFGSASIAMADKGNLEQCSDKEAGGIFLYALGPYTWTFDIINLSANDIKIGGVPNPAIFSIGDVISAYRAKKFQYHVVAGTQRWEGNLSIKTGISGNLYDFNVSFAKSSGLNDLYPSTWIFLPVPSTGPYIKTTNWAYGRWSTGVPQGGDHKMHNIMTIVSDKVTASLFSVDNKHVVLVVTDCPTGYGGWQLDWIWNNGRSVPSQCTQCCLTCPHNVDCNL
jgi:hypothetical protein